MVCAGQFLPLPFELSPPLVCGFHGGDLRANVVEERQDLLRARAVLALQAVERGEAVLDFLQTRRVGFEMGEVIPHRVRGFVDGDGGGAEAFAHPVQPRVDAAQFFEFPHRCAKLRDGGLGGIVKGSPGGVGGFFQTRGVLQDAPLLIERGVLAGLRRDRLDFLALEVPDVEEAQLLLLGAVEFLEFAGDVAPASVQGSGFCNCDGRAREGIEHFQLGLGGEQHLLIVLPVYVAEVRSEIPEQRRGDRAAAGEGARFSFGRNFALQQQFALFHFDAGGFEQILEGFVARELEQAGNARPRGAGTHGVLRCAAAEEQRQRVHHDRLAAARFAGQKIEAGVKAHADALDDRIVLNHEIQEHSRQLYPSGSGA